MAFPTPKRNETSTVDSLDRLEAETITILREAYRASSKPCMLWSIGKDSTALLWMARKAFLGRVPFPLVLLETHMELPEVYAFRDEYIEKWSLDYFSQECPPESAVDQTLPPATRAAARKTEGLRTMLREQNFDAVLVGIRRDEQAMRAKERVFSPRRIDGTWDVKEQPPEFWGYYTTSVPDGAHLRVHPLLSWTELDIWEYTQRENIPYVPLYLARNGKRYRSLGEKNITLPIESNADTIEAIIAELKATRVPERAGRTMDNESEASFERLRAGGYM
jgi:sulfate adenylyltransferase subunit 2